MPLVRSLRNSLLATILLLPCFTAFSAEDVLKKDFAAPSSEYRPWVIWFWINGNVTKEGITADLEAMKRVGIGGMMIMEVTRQEPTGPVAYMSPQWLEMVKFAMQEAGRLGLKIDMNNGGGWSGSGGPWITPENAMQEVTSSATDVTGGAKFDGILPEPKKALFYRDIAVLAVPATEALPTPAPKATPVPKPGGKVKKPKPPEPIPGFLKKAVSWDHVSGGLATPLAPFPASQVIDLTGKMDESGHLTWDAPPGKWTVLRIGHTFTDSRPQEAPHTGSGPECDKLSKAGVDANFNGMLAKVIKDIGPLAGKVLVAGHIDSWEDGSQNWTTKMPEEFRKRRGYDITPWLPVLTGRVVDSPALTERFLWDFRKTISELLAENYVARMRELCNQNGLRFSMECYDTIGDDLDVAEGVEIPVGEFWWPLYTLGPTLREMSSVSHVNDHPVTGCEAFTAHEDERWLAHPRNLKALADRALCDGINQFWFHRYTMQPWSNIRPGLSMGLFGVHYERTQTWWENTVPWHEYLTRCQYLLRQGMYVADAICLAPDEPMLRFPAHKDIDKPVVSGGYDYDVVGSETFIEKAQVKNGRIIVPGGMSWRLLVLPDSKTMTTEMLAKITGLVNAGAAILGDPPQATPGLTDFPRASPALRASAAALWGSSPVPDRTVGKGRVFTGMTPEQALAKLGVAPDFASDQPLHWIHRSDNGAEIYFVANTGTTPVSTTGTFRVSGKRPEIWNAETGQVADAPVYSVKKDSTSVPLQLAPSEAFFVIFREPASPASQVVSVSLDTSVDLVAGLAWKGGTCDIKTADGKTRSVVIPALPEPQQIEGPWELKFPPNAGAPDKVTLDKLISWSDSTDPGVKHFSGTATYVKTINIPAASLGDGRRVFLDLGDVQVMAHPTLNGKDLGILWKAPFRVDITDAVKAGDNQLEIRVVNLWANRMIGDEDLPPDSERSPLGLVINHWPDWVLQGKSSPTGRFTFSSFNLWKKGEALQPSGLLGPVRIVYAQSLK